MNFATLGHRKSLVVWVVRGNSKQSATRLPSTSKRMMPLAKQLQGVPINKSLLQICAIFNKEKVRLDVAFHRCSKVFFKDQRFDQKTSEPSLSFFLYLY